MAWRTRRPNHKPTSRESDDERYIAEQRKLWEQKHREELPNDLPFVIRMANSWWNRVISSVYSGGLAAQTEQYTAHATRRDYLWNSVGQSAWGFLFPLISIVATQLSGADLAGMFTMAYTIATVLMWLGNYGVRTYQVSDLEEAHSFYDYLINRILTCVVMAAAAWLWCSVRHYTQPMLTICWGVFAFRIVDAAADVFEGRLQQMDKLYLAGISQALRCVAAFIPFTLVLLLFRSVPMASVALAIGGIASLVVVTIPLTLLETPRSRKMSFVELQEIFIDCFPLFSALFLYALIDCVPKLVMEGALSYDNQLYFNAMYFPTHSIIMAAGLIYRPQLVRLANIWAQPSQRPKFSRIVFLMLAVIAVISVIVGVFMYWVGIPLMNLMYGLNFTKYASLVMIMVVSGFFAACVEFLYQIITLLRAQGTVSKIYLVTFWLTIVISELLVRFSKLEGAVMASMISMGVLLIMLLMQYFSIRSQK